MADIHGLGNAVIADPNDHAVELPANQAASAITPGKLIEDDGSGDFQHVSTEGTQPYAWADMHPLQQDTDKDTDYDSGDPVHPVGGSGFFVHAFLATGNNVTKGDELVADASGNLKVRDGHNHDVDTTTSSASETSTTEEADVVVAVAEEDLNNTSGTPSRIKVRSML